MKTVFFRSLVIGLGLFLGAAAIGFGAQGLATEKARMSERLPKLDALKASGAIGENNRGMVEVRAPGGDAAAVTAEENHDREVVYAAIAKQTGTSADQVGRARAKQIATGSAKGVWVQHEDGSWSQK